ncbi:hypothetical protein PaecuDRAFT_4277 [Paenibacillus curdlanolyticus YK9]|uniref:Lipoprotein n=1 Tax=Paenibacillus curdlanolyticus YK9 TaxID=717606 RepID=E0IF36_9BACL|nr:hypothetical protein [Paenibacillus curdlanolyticus]EFM08812.1 hypothetical protein PaecuDRAFT_4277 [Paenibacillus curdlanolyticus YK9]
MKSIIFLTCICIFLLCSACSSKEKNLEGSSVSHYYSFSGTIGDAVHQKKPIQLENNLEENYTMILRGFVVSESEFELYNKQYDQSTKDRILTVTKETRFFILSNDKKQKDAVDIEKFLQYLTENKEASVEFWAYLAEQKQVHTEPANHINKYLVADEINVIRNP